MDNAQVTSQMAQINTVTGIDKLNDDAERACRASSSQRRRCRRRRWSATTCCTAATASLLPGKAAARPASSSPAAADEVTRRDSRRAGTGRRHRSAGRAGRRHRTASTGTASTDRRGHAEAMALHVPASPPPCRRGTQLDALTLDRRRGRRASASAARELQLNTIGLRRRLDRPGQADSSNSFAGAQDHGFQQGLSGLNAARKNLDVIGNNIANASTVGFKASRAEFADIYANALTAPASTSVGIGCKVARGRAAVHAGQHHDAPATRWTSPSTATASSGMRRQRRDRRTRATASSRSTTHGYIVNDEQAEADRLRPTRSGNIVASARRRRCRSPTGGIAPQRHHAARRELNLDSRATPPPTALVRRQSIRPPTTTRPPDGVRRLGNPHVLTLLLPEDRAPTRGTCYAHRRRHRVADANLGAGAGLRSRCNFNSGGALTDRACRSTRRVARVDGGATTPIDIHARLHRHDAVRLARSASTT